MNRIMLDCTQIPVKKAGVGIYVLELVKQIKLQNTDNIYVLIVQDDDPDFMNINGDNIISIPINSNKYRKLHNRFYFEQVLLPRLIKKHKINVCHSMHYSFPVFARKVKKVVTIHDMTFFLFPECHKLISKIYLRTFSRMASKKADSLIFVSKSTQNDFNEIMGNVRAKEKIIHLGVSDDFHQYEIAEIEKSLSKYMLPNEYILFMGTIEPRKNVLNLVMAYQQLSETMELPHLVIVGKKGWFYEDIFRSITEKNRESIHFTGFIDEEDKPKILSGANLFIYPSIYEGFGIPVLEGMASGVPVISSNISSMPEVLGDCGLYVDPHSIDDIADGIKKLSTNKELREKFSKAGMERARKFTWEIMAQKTIQTYEEC